MNGPNKRRERAWIGAVLLSNSKEPIEYFFCKEPIDCATENTHKTENKKQGKGA